MLLNTLTSIHGPKDCLLTIFGGRLKSRAKKATVKNLLQTRFNQYFAPVSMIEVLAQRLQLHCKDISTMDIRIQLTKHRDSDSHIEMIDDTKDEDGDSLVSDLPHEDSALLVQFQGSTSNLKTRMVKSFSVPKSISSQSRKTFCTDAVKVKPTLFTQKQ